MSKWISQQQLESYLWGAAVLLRGTIDAGDYKQFIFPLLFQSMSVGLGVGIGSTLRTSGKLTFSIVVRIVMLLLIVPLGLLIVGRFGQYGAVWWAGLVDLALTTILIGLVWRVLPQPDKTIR